MKNYSVPFHFDGNKLLTTFTDMSLSSIKNDPKTLLRIFDLENKKIEEVEF